MIRTSLPELDIIIKMKNDKLFMHLLKENVRNGFSGIDAIKKTFNDKKEVIEKWQELTFETSVMSDYCGRKYTARAKKIQEYLAKEVYHRNKHKGE